MSQITVTVQNLQQIARTAKTQSRELSSVQRTINSSIVSSGWTSPAAARFKNDWNTHYTKSLRDLEAALVSLSDAAQKMAQNYEATEASYQGIR
jgi:WXG100 family type VII secretion target